MRIKHECNPLPLPKVDDSPPRNTTHTHSTIGQVALRYIAATIADGARNGLYVVLKHSYQRSAHGSTGTGRRAWGCSCEARNIRSSCRRDQLRAKSKLTLPFVLGHESRSWLGKIFWVRCTCSVVDLRWRIEWRGIGEWWVSKVRRRMWRVVQVKWKRAAVMKCTVDYDSCVGLDGEFGGVDESGFIRRRPALR